MAWPLFIVCREADISAMTAKTDIPDPAAPQLPATIARYERIVERGFWDKLLAMAGRVPFSEDLAAAYYCVADPTTPGRVKGVLLAALAYFVMPFDAIPDVIAGIGYTDDAAVFLAMLSIVGKHLKPRHRTAAKAAVARLRDEG
jgi:uncharacterized membrane protein YkvA (DUF1232 family)